MISVLQSVDSHRSKAVLYGSAKTKHMHTNSLRCNSVGQQPLSYQYEIISVSVITPFTIHSVLTDHVIS